MKQWLILICTSLLLLISGFFEINYLDKSSDKLLYNINSSKNALNLEDLETPGKLYKTLEDEWEIHKRRLVVFYR